MAPESPARGRRPSGGLPAKPSARPIAAAAVSPGRPPRTPAPRTGQLDDDVFDIIVRQKNELAAENERLRAEPASFQLAWQEERAAHQRDVASSSVALAQAQVQAEEGEERRAEAEAERQAAASEVDALRSELSRAREELSFRTREHDEERRTLQRQVARTRAEKGALCEEFTAKLEALVHGTGLGIGGGGSGVSDAPMASALLDSLGEAGAGYEELSVFTGVS